MEEYEFCYIRPVDTENNFQFILKDFVTGFVVIALLVASGIYFLNRTSLSGYFSGFKSKDTDTSSTADNPSLCSTNAVFGGLDLGASLVYIRSTKRSDSNAHKYGYVTKYTVVGPGAISYDLSYDVTTLPLEKYDLQCDSEGVAFLKPDSIVLATLFNTDRENLDSFASFSSPEGSVYWWLPHSFDDSKPQSWSNSFSLKGGLIPANYSVASDTIRYCYKLDVTSDSAYEGHDKVRVGDAEYDGYKVGSSMRGVLNILMSKPQNVAECEKLQGVYDASVEVSFERQVWYIPGLGLARQVIAPLSVTGQGYLLPGGFALPTVSDELVSASGAN